MDRGVAQAVAPTLGGCAIAWVFFDVRHHVRIENALAIVRGSTAAIEVEGGTSHVHPDLLGHLLQGAQTLGKEHHIGLIDRSHRDRG
jgi:hypothetical protein